MKTTVLLIISLFTLFANISLGQGNCPGDAFPIDNCGQSFQLTNSTAIYDACSPGSCGGFCPQCVGQSNNANFDSNCTTSAPGGNCGCDLNGSIENNVWFSFTPAESCSYQIEVTVSNCNSTSGLQYAVYGWNPPNPISVYYDHVSAAGIYYNNTTTNTYNLTAGLGVYLMFDGFAGSVCDISIVITPGANCAGCNLILECYITGVLEVCQGGTTQLTGTGTGTPAATNPWVSSNTAVATVNNTGLVTGVSAGTSEITYTDSDGCQTTQTVTVSPSLTPTFNQVAPICAGGVFTLPTTSIEGVTGTWSPAINNTVTTEYTFTPSAGQCAATAIMTVEVNTPITPTFDQIGPICSGDAYSLPTTSTNGYTGSWSPAINNTTTTEYTFTPNAGQCAAITTMIVVANAPVTPAFNQIAPICVGGSFLLPTTSIEGVTGTWSPATNNTATTEYLFTPNTGQCATTTTMTVQVGDPVTPTFDQVAPICAGDVFTLPITSLEGYTGTWSPAINNTATTEYTYTPDAGLCATTAAMTVVVNAPITPTFSQVAPICAGDVFTLPTTSIEGVTGTWSPATNNTATTEYLFTPAAGQCATTSTMTVIVDDQITPDFTQVAPICAGETFTLPTTSTNGITGTWSPAINNAATTEYTFTPAAGQCATTATMTVMVNTPTTPTFNQIGPFCEGNTFTLPTSSTNGYTGSWTPTINNTTTTQYMFTPDAGQCATTATMTVVVNTPVTPTFNQIAPVCVGDAFTLPTTSTNGYTGSWSPAINNTTTTEYTFTPNTGQCATTTTMTVQVGGPVIPTFNPVAPICAGEGLTLPTTSTNGYTGSWSPAINNTATTEYTFTPTAGQCATTATMTVTVNSLPVIGLISIEQISCNGETDGSIEVNITSGAAPFSYNWNPNIGNSNTGSNLGAGSYNLNVLDANGCEANATFVITEPQPIIVNSIVSNVICGESTGSIDLEVTGGVGPYIYNWSPNNESTQGINNLLAGSYSVFISDANGCEASQNYTIILTGNIALGVNVTSLDIVEGDTVLILVDGADSYVWSPSESLSCSECDSLIGFPVTTTSYQVYGVDSAGCIGSASFTIFVEPYCEDFFVPNAFSPNNQGPEANNTLCIIGKCITSLNYEVFNRWGEQVYSTSNINECWDGTFRGKPVGTGVYVYKLNVTLSNGKEIEQHGSLTIVY
jgi:gliding motility-associated-like protein